MAEPNFKFFAMQYLNDWVSNDEEFVRGLSVSESPDVRLDALHRAAKYYKVTRNFKTDATEVRLAGVLQDLDGVAVPSNESVDEAVHSLADALKKRYGQYAVSAASKFLWLKFRNDIVILDSRAADCLWKRGAKLDGTYSTYRRRWLEHFRGQHDSIKRACAALPGVKGFSLAADRSDDQIREFAESRWFQDRVFDKFLWWYADSDPV